MKGSGGRGAGGIKRPFGVTGCCREEVKGKVLIGVTKVGEWESQLRGHLRP